MKSTRVRVILAVVAAGAALTACSPSQAGAAAIVGDRRISTSELNADVREYEKAMSEAGVSRGQLRLPGSIPQAVLGNKIFISQIDQIGARSGITVTAAEVEALIAQVLQQQQGATVDQLALNNAVPPSELNALVRASLIQQKLMAKYGAGQDEASQQAAGQKLAAEVQKIAPVTRSPRYGEANPQAQAQDGSDSFIESDRFGALPGAAESR
ncbi:SurA N-terminal domain-containing protein [Planomonospora sp. ID67723]|uniref:SurA N-terminal domain-containing protein n=1 Tax=Planomonospora sp. ID67723 TaxID=2738134 RepID=UPI0018C37171|nr:SurA N-terminal domain-containing protein [Planomonospora sp. ID67723]MBG0826282.1 SurA N-terminal domain-containing protein [Planomonospora sp. ID67723]